MTPRFRLLTLATAVTLAACGVHDRPSAPRAAAAAPSTAVRAPVPSGAIPATPAVVGSADGQVRDPASFPDPQTRAAYAAARKYAAVLEHIYCHCHCRENMGHRALIACFETDHGAGCDICQNEAMITARMAVEGRSAAQIQQAIDAYYAA